MLSVMWRYDDKRVLQGIVHKMSWYICEPLARDVTVSTQTWSERYSANATPWNWPRLSPVSYSHIMFTLVL